MTLPTAVTARAPAKINLELRVGAPREDGFHELATLFQALSLADEVTLTGAGGSLTDGIEVSVEGTHADRVPRDGSNLATRAVRLLAEQFGIDDAVAIHIRKRIPVAGGMAGGSADAAAALLAADALWHLGLGRDGLRELAAELGSDVPFCLLGGTAIGTGRGERLTPAMTRGLYSWVIALQPTGLSTAAVYAETDRLRAGRVLPVPRIDDTLMHALRSGNAEAVGANLANDLQPAACSLLPELVGVLEVGQDGGALGALVSGSGPSVAFLVGDREHALDVASTLTSCGLVHQVCHATGPAPGARVIDG